MKTFHVKQAASSSLQNKINTSLVFNYLREHGPLYRAQIAKGLRLSAPAVSRAILNLVQESYIVETTDSSGDAGKRGIRFSVNSDRGFVLGIDLLKEPICVAVSDFSCRLIKKYDCFKMKETTDVEGALVAHLDRIIRAQRRPNDLKAICIGAPAVIDSTGAVSSAVLYEGLEGKNLKNSMERSFKVPVYVENDANLAALAEHQFGAGRGFQSLIFFQLSDGVSAGIIIDHALYRGHHGAAGEIGFTVLNEEHLPERSGRKGPLENCASIEAIRARAIAMTKDQPSSPLLELAGGQAENITPELVCQCALNGDPVCSNVIRETAVRLGIAIANAALVVDPQRIILGGGVCRLPGVEQLFETPIFAVIRRLLPFSSPDFTISSLHDDAVVVGASYMAVESLLVGAYPNRITA